MVLPGSCPFFWIHFYLGPDINSYIRDRAQAKKLIIHYSNKRRSQVLLNDLINSEDAISAVANSLMIADWTYDCDRDD